MHISLPATPAGLAGPGLKVLIRVEVGGVEKWADPEDEKVFLRRSSSRSARCFIAWSPAGVAAHPSPRKLAIKLAVMAEAAG